MQISMLVRQIIIFSFEFRKCKFSTIIYVLQEEGFPLRIVSWYRQTKSSQLLL